MPSVWLTSIGSTTTYVPNGSTLARRANALISASLRLRAFMSDIRRPAGLSRQHPEHGCTDLLRYSVPSQGLFPLFTELHTTAQRRQAACRSIRVFVTPHAGSDGNFTRQISAKFNSFRVMNRPVLLRISAQVVRQQSARRPRTGYPGRRCPG